MSSLLFNSGGAIYGDSFRADLDALVAAHSGGVEKLCSAAYYISLGDRIIHSFNEIFANFRKQYGSSSQMVIEEELLGVALLVWKMKTLEMYAPSWEQEVPVLLQLASADHPKTYALQLIKHWGEISTEDDTDSSEATLEYLGVPRWLQQHPSGNRSWAWELLSLTASYQSCEFIGPQLIAHHHSFGYIPSLVPLARSKGKKLRKVEFLKALTRTDEIEDSLVRDFVQKDEVKNPMREVVLEARCRMMSAILGGVDNPEARRKDKSLYIHDHCYLQALGILWSRFGQEVEELSKRQVAIRDE